MSHRKEQHKQGYFAFRRGMRFTEIASNLNVSQGIARRWAGSEMACDCVWHNWDTLKQMDSDENHRRAYALATTGGSVHDIAMGLGIPENVIVEWSHSHYPCDCGCHGWSNQPKTETHLPVEASPREMGLTSAVMSEDVDSAHTSAIQVALDAVSHTVVKGDVAPRSWKDVLETIKVCDQVLKGSGPIISQKPKSSSKSPVTKFTETSTKSVEIPGGPRGDLTDLAQKLKSMATSQSNITGEDSLNNLVPDDNDILQ